MNIMGLLMRVILSIESIENLSKLAAVKQLDNHKKKWQWQNGNECIHWKEHNDQKMFHYLFQSKILKSLLKVA